MQVDVSEIESSTFELTQKYFRVEDGPRLDNFVMDGRRLLAASGTKYDLIFGDASTHLLYSVVFSEIETFRQVFDNTYVFAAGSPETIQTPQSIILV